MMEDVRTDRVGVAIDDNLIGFAVVGRDGKVGRVTHVNYAGTCLTVSMGGLLKKTHHVVPAFAIDAIDLDTKTVDVALTRPQVERAPEYDEHVGLDEGCEERMEQYYAALLREQL
jgi:hypothetical protein